MSERGLRELVELICRASTPTEVTGHVMDRLPALVSSPVVGVFLIGGEGHPTALDFHSEHAARHVRLAEHYFDRGLPNDDLLSAVVKAALPMHDLMLRSDATWRLHPMFVRFGKSQNLRHYGGSPLVSSGLVAGVIACARDDGAPPLRTRELLTMATVAMHAQDRLARLRDHRPRCLFEKLSPKQLVVCRLVSAGLSNREVAARLGVTVDTVKWHLKEIFKRVALESRDELISNFLFWDDDGR